MSVKIFIIYLIAFIVDISMIYFIPGRSFPTSHRVKKVKLKRFWFLFYENIGENYRTHKVYLSVFIFSIIGYIVNIAALISHIICFHFGIDTTTLVLIITALDWIGCFIFAVWASSG